MAIPGNKYVYSHPSGAGFGEAVRADAGYGEISAEMSELDLKDGTEVTFLDYDADSEWPMIEWIDAVGINRITTIDPVAFDSNFNPV